MRSEADAVESEYNFKSEQYASGEISLEEYELAAAKTKRMIHREKLLIN